VVAPAPERFERIREWSLWLAGALALFHLLNVAGLLLLPTVAVRIVHLAVVIVLVCARLGANRGRQGRVLAILLALGGAASGAYLLGRWDSIAESGGITNDLDLWVAGMLVVLVLLATYRAVGWVLPLITAAFLLYPFVAPYLPGVLYGRAVRLEGLLSFLVLSGDGIYGIPLGVASTYIVLFTIFGAFLGEFGAADFFFKIAHYFTHGFRAAGAKSAVFLSALFGMISGSAAGNVAVTGSFTIPLMRREGYAPHQAGAVEAVVSTGGQIMPPVMGAAAFLMAEILGIPYVEVMRAAVIPAGLFFLSVLLVVHLLAVKNGIGASGEPVTAPIGWSWLVQGARFWLPFALLIGLMVSGYSPVKASVHAIVALLVVQLLLEPRLTRAFFSRLGRALSKGVLSAVPISMACAAAGVIAAVLATTGLGSKLSGLIIALSGGYAVAALLLTMLTAIVLGMGLPTTAAYLMLATVVAPALADIGIPLLTAHMFVFFFGCLAAITPPVALASYVAAGIADADLNRVGWTAFRYGLVCYLLPFAFYFSPGLLAQGTWSEILFSVVSAAAGVVLLASAIVGQSWCLLRWPARSLLSIAGLLLLSGSWMGSALGLMLTLGMLGLGKVLRWQGS
jgi:TRAP transporter 4TM/12TM fusion protein